MTTNNIIEVKNLTVAFGKFKAVDGISFSIKRGEIFGFLGANGAGKTTTIRTICGILNPTSGQVLVNGRDVSVSTAVLKPHIGYMSQKFMLYPDLTVKENMSFAGSLYNMREEDIEKRSGELFKFIGMEHNIPGAVKNLSGGVKQIIALCAALLHNPDLIFLDEPTAGTSPAARRDFWRLIQKLAAGGKTVFVTTHYMDEAEYCNRIVLMEKGRIIAFDTPEGLKKTFFKQKPLELTMLKPDILPAVKAEFDALNIGMSAVFGSNLRVSPDNFENFKKFADGNKENFDYKEIEPTLDDVFLKALKTCGNLNGGEK